MHKWLITAAFSTIFLLSETGPACAQAAGAPSGSGKSTVPAASPASSLQSGTCEGALAAVSLPEGLTPDKTCSVLGSAVSLATSGDGSPSERIQYSAEEDGFYRALSKSLRRYGGRDSVTVSIAGAGAPVITTESIRMASAPTYREIGLGIWLDRIEDTGGTLCVKNSDQALGVAAIATVLDFFFRKAIPFIINKYNAAIAYRPAKKIDAVIYKTSTGSEAGRITKILFVPRGTAKECQSSTI